ncbi:MAG: hypothetical protein ACYS5V_01020 [Planctomycetota bacterium]|jgi:hypothetical protein
MTPRPVGTLQAVRFLARIGVRRKLNQLSAKRGSLKWFGRGKATVKRQGTPRRSVGLKWLLWVFGPLLLLWAIHMAANLVAGVGAHFRHQAHADDSRIAVRPYVFKRITETQQELRRLAGQGPATSSAPARPLDDGAAHALKMKRLTALSLLSSCFASEAQRPLGPRGDPSELAERWMEVFKTRGPDGFRREPRPLIFVPWPSVRSWPEGPAAARMVPAVAALLIFCCVALLVMSLGSGNRDLGQVHWHMQWLFTFPVRARAIFLGQVLESSVLSPAVWIVVFPLLLAVYWSAGYAGWALLLAPVVTVPVALLMGSCRMLAETFLRRRLSRKRLKSCQAAFTVLGIICLMSLLFLINVRPLPGPVGKALGFAPSWLAWTPLGAPALLCGRPLPVVWPLAVTALWGAALTWGAIRAAEWLVRDGLMGSTGAYQGARGRRSGVARCGLLKGILGKEIRLLLRDRNFFVQTLITPLLVIGFQVVVQGYNLRRVRAGFGSPAAAAIAFGVGAYVLMFGGFHALGSEGKTVWLLYTVPRRLDALLARKARLWGTVGLCYAAAALIPAWILKPPGTLTDVISALMALVGIYIQAFLAVSLGAMGVDVLEPNPQRRVRSGWFFAYMFLAGIYGVGVYCPWLALKPVIVALWCLMAWGIWRKMAARLPYLLDSSDRTLSQAPA